MFVSSLLNFSAGIDSINLFILHEILPSLGLWDTIIYWLHFVHFWSFVPSPFSFNVDSLHSSSLVSLPWIILIPSYSNSIYFLFIPKYVPLAHVSPLKPKPVYLIA